MNVLFACSYTLVAVAGGAITLAAVAVAVRHALRHTLLSVRALAPVRTSAPRFVRTRPC